MHLPSQLACEASASHLAAVALPCLAGCAELCHAVLCCAVLCCAVLCCAALPDAELGIGREVAKAKGVKPGQLALAWVHAQVLSHCPPLI